MYKRQALPDQLFYNTGISTYFWIITNRKSPQRKGKVQLIDARDMFTKMRKSLGEKRKEVSQADIDEIVRTYGAFEERTADADSDAKQVGCKIFTNESFGFLRITVERPLKLRFDITSERLDALAENAKFAKLSEAEQEAVVEYLRPLAEHELGPTADYCLLYTSPSPRD